MKYKIVDVKNVAQLMSSYDNLLRTGVASKMMVVYGVAGMGKTIANTLLANRVDAVMVRASPTWTISTALAMIMRELGANPMRSSADNEQYIIEKLNETNRPLFIDEVDAFLDPQVRGARYMAILETVRRIHDIANVPVVLIGMKGIERQLETRAQIVRRITQWVEFKPSDLEDFKKIALACCEVQVTDDLLSKAFLAAKGNIGLLVVALVQIERFGKSNRLEIVGLKEWGNRKFNLRGDCAGDSHDGN